jgi:predicted O-methyltransferase YrrM
LPTTLPPSQSTVRRPFIAKATRGLFRRLFGWAERFSARRSLHAAGIYGAESIFTFTRPLELVELFNLARECSQGARALEIGSYLGASACYLAAGLAHVGGTLVCVDTWQNQTMPDGEHDTFAEFQKNVAAVRERLTLIRKPTQELSAAELGGPFDLVFIDGDHSYEAVRRDFELVEPCVKPRGVVALHDVRAHPGVGRLVGDVVASGKWTPLGMTNDLIWLRRQTKPAE